MAEAQPNRLPRGGRIDRSRSLKFFFDGRKYNGYAGDTLASALLANGVALVGRSFKLRRPRGIFGSGAEEPNAIVQIGGGAAAQPNLRATQVELRDGLVARSVRGWPSPRFDMGAVAGAFSRVLGAGFYYKTFMFPRSWWKLYEHAIRRSAGFGQAPAAPDPDAYEHRNAHCDVLVVGGGPAGLMAALAAAKSGARVILADDGAEFGGALLASADRIDSLPAADWISGVVAELRETPDCILLPHCAVFGYFDHNFLTAAGGRRQWRIRAKRVVLAQGAFERPLTFCNNDRPGVMLAAAISTYINRYAVAPGRRAVIFTNNDSAYRVALDWAAAGREVAAVVDSRPTGGGELAERAKALNIPIRTGCVVRDVKGGRRVESVEIAEWSGDAWGTVNPGERIACDLLGVSGGWSPAVHLHAQAGGGLEWDAEKLCFLPGEVRRRHDSAGAGNGEFDLGGCLADGLRAGTEAAASLGLHPAEVEMPVVDAIEEVPSAALWRVPAARDADRCPKQFLDFQNDTTVADIRLAAREGFRDIEHVKRYTALGFGTDQGKLGNINGMAVLADTVGKTIPEVGTTTFRPAYTPVRFGTVAGESTGDLYDPVRKTALHEWHEQAGAPMEVVGQWHRPWYFPRGGEDMAAAVTRECLAVRNAVGVMDASTLGKIDARGPDVVEFLEQIYTHNVGQMPIGRCAYGVILGEDGMIRDDGVMARLGESHFYLTTTTGGAGAVLDWLERWLQTEWPELEVYLTSLTEQYSTIVLAGPNSRAVLRKLGCDRPLDGDGFPFMTVKPAVLAGLPVSLFRVSFSGELAFEINVSSDRALSLWRQLLAAGGEFDITPYGTETMHVLRAEKGFIIVGQDTDGSVAPTDLGMGWLLAKDKDFLGKRSLRRADLLREDRKQLVGLLSDDGRTVLPEGAQLIEQAHRRRRPPVPIRGHVTSSYRSPSLGHPVALALLAGGRSRMGDTLLASTSGGKQATVRVVPPVFYDPKGERREAAEEGRRGNSPGAGAAEATETENSALAAERRRHGLETFFSAARAAPDARLRAAAAPGRGFINLRFDPNNTGAFAAAAGILGQEPLLRANTFSMDTTGRRLYWLGPNEWLVETAADAAAALAGELAAALDEFGGAVNDLGGAYAALRLAGAEARELLAKGCTLDLHPREFVPGQCARAGLARVNVLLAAVDAAEPAFLIIVGRSYADYLCRWLGNAARPSGIDFQTPGKSPG